MLKVPFRRQSQFVHRSAQKVLRSISNLQQTLDLAASSTSSSSSPPSFAVARRILAPLVLRRFVAPEYTIPKSNVGKVAAVRRRILDMMTASSPLARDAAAAANHVVDPVDDAHGTIREILASGIMAFPVLPLFAICDSDAVMRELRGMDDVDASTSRKRRQSADTDNIFASALKFAPDSGVASQTAKFREFFDVLEDRPVGVTRSNLNINSNHKRARERRTKKKKNNNNKAQNESSSPPVGSTATTKDDDALLYSWVPFVEPFPSAKHTFEELTRRFSSKHGTLKRRSVDDDDEDNNDNNEAQQQQSPKTLSQSRQQRVAKLRRLLNGGLHADAAADEDGGDAALLVDDFDFAATPGVRFHVETVVEPDGRVRVLPTKSFAVVPVRSSAVSIALSKSGNSNNSSASSSSCSRLSAPPSDPELWVCMCGLAVPLATSFHHLFANTDLGRSSQLLRAHRNGFTGKLIQLLRETKEQAQQQQQQVSSSAETEIAAFWWWYVWTNRNSTILMMMTMQDNKLLTRKTGLNVPAAVQDALQNARSLLVSGGVLESADGSAAPSSSSSSHHPQSSTYGSDHRYALYLLERRLVFDIGSDFSKLRELVLQFRAMQQQTATVPRRVILPAFRRQYMSEMMRWRYWRLLHSYFPQLSINLALLSACSAAKSDVARVLADDDCYKRKRSTPSVPVHPWITSTSVLSFAPTFASPAATDAMKSLAESIAPPSLTATKMSRSLSISLADVTTISANDKPQRIYEMCCPAVDTHSFWTAFIVSGTASRISWHRLPPAQRLILDHRLPPLRARETPEDPSYQYVLQRIEEEAEKAAAASAIGEAEESSSSSSNMFLLRESHHHPNLSFDYFYLLVRRFRADWAKLHPVEQSRFYNHDRIKRVFPDFGGFQRRDVAQFRKDFLYGIEALQYDASKFNGAGNLSLLSSSEVEAEVEADDAPSSSSATAAATSSHHRDHHFGLRLHLRDNDAFLMEQQRQQQRKAAMPAPEQRSFWLNGMGLVGEFGGALGGADVDADRDGGDGPRLIVPDDMDDDEEEEVEEEQGRNF